MKILPYTMRFLALHLSTLYFQNLQSFSNNNVSPTNLLYSIWLFLIIVAFYIAIKIINLRKHFVSQCQGVAFMVEKSWGRRLKQKTTLSLVRKQKAKDAGAREHLHFCAVQDSRTP